ncbi:protein MAIN-LIKE 1-like [Glycine soja]|uniref:protein MAIN-LIKE 1-like n=1 Tax=Glycine max TaxID=3847 RepID=UPI0007193CC2|nr:protein MAIN-LIKE 1-like [Glycine max]XP_028230709.1 protein MAIN-LIKE 1-like [Glycine soja]|eukprot:XP_014631474.1 protein MAIN-LIKE 1-like [Glycine max]
MVRTRGLGRAFARVISRGMGRQDEHHADDVPWRCRPTASTRRQWIHVVVADDVPHMTEDVPQMTADECPKLKLVSHGRKVEKFWRPTFEIEGLVTATGLTPLIGCSVVTGDSGVISAFVERWHRETSTFHLLVGELTITLGDVASLLHLPITDSFHNFEPLPVDEAVVLLMELLEVSGEEARAETVRAHGAYVRLSWLRDIYQRRYEARRWIVATRAYLFHLSGGYAWVAVALVHMYDQLNEASQTTTRQIAGYLTILQIYEHFPSVHDCVTDDGYDKTSPRASRWLTTKAHMKGITGASYRTRLDALTIIDVC